jgi:hypothetical protein
LPELQYWEGHPGFSAFGQEYVMHLGLKEIALIAITLLGSAGVGFAVWILYRTQTNLTRRMMSSRDFYDWEIRDRVLREFQRSPETVKPEPRQKTLAERVEEKKKIQDITSISFHFVDEGEVTNFYNDTFKEPTVESLVTEIAGQVGGEVKAGLPKLLEAKIGGNDLSKWISTIKLPDASLPGMFARYQREAIKRGEVALGSRSSTLS